MKLSLNPARHMPALALAGAFHSLATTAVAAEEPYFTNSGIKHTIDVATQGPRFDGLGAISGGGATSRLLVDYPEPQRSEVLDLLFKPQFGASLHILKVEMGGDSQSTDGTESSHMHDRGEADCAAGYEWWLLREAKRRNPDIITYGLPWAFAGWVLGNSTAKVNVKAPPADQNPFARPDLTVEYVLNWVQCAKHVHDINIDYLGLWNEQSAPGEAAYAKLLRKALDANGFQNTRLVAKDAWEDICTELADDAEYLEAVDAVGLHYPTDYTGDGYKACHDLGKPLWASEESSSYDDRNGAMCWARVVASHFVKSGMTSSIMWNLVGSYYHGTNWYASSLLTADQPWTGWYSHDNKAPVLWAMAHYTQFTQPGWRYLPVGSGSGELPLGGYFNTFVSPDGDDFTLVAVKMSRDHGSCTRPPLPDFDVKRESVTFRLAGGHKPGDKKLHLWYSNFEFDADEYRAPTLFGYRGTLFVDLDGTFTLGMSPGDVFTISTVDTATKGVLDRDVPESDPRFPLPHKDDFEGYRAGRAARYFADQIGVWEVHPEQHFGPQSSHWHGVAAGESLRRGISAALPNSVLRQMVPRRPLEWSHSHAGPVSVVGMREFNDLTVSAKFRLFPPARRSSEPDDLVAACLGARADQLWMGGVALCVSARGNWTLSYGGPQLGGWYEETNVVATGRADSGPGLGAWHELSLTASGEEASGSLDGTALFTSVAVRDVDTGFAVVGTNMWAPVEFDDFSMSLARPVVATVPSVGKVAGGPVPAALWAGRSLGVSPCARNGVADPAQNFILKANWQMYHVASGLCAEVSGTSGRASVALASCHKGEVRQQLRNDYSLIRHRPVPITLGSYKTLPETMTLVGFKNGTVAIVPDDDKEERQHMHRDGDAGVISWREWTLFPNTGQLRNQYNTNVSLGYPMCLTVVSSYGFNEATVETHI